MKRILLVVVPTLLAVTGVAGAAAVSSSEDGDTDVSPPVTVIPDEPHATGGDDVAKPQQEADDEGMHGGPIERFHDPAVCDLVDVSRLPGNWTHGDYVSAVEALGQPELVPIAARSPCGKPAHAGGPSDHAGPPEHAGPPDHAGPPEHAGPPDHAGAPDDAGPPESS